MFVTGKPSKLSLQTLLGRRIINDDRTQLDQQRRTKFISTSLELPFHVASWQTRIRPNKIRIYLPLHLLFVELRSKFILRTRAFTLKLLKLQRNLVWRGPDTMKLLANFFRRKIKRISTEHSVQVDHWSRIWIALKVSIWSQLLVIIMLEISQFKWSKRKVGEKKECRLRRDFLLKEETACQSNFIENQNDKCNANLMSPSWRTNKQMIVCLNAIEQCQEWWCVDTVELG